VRTATRKRIVSLAADAGPHAIPNEGARLFAALEMAFPVIFRRADEIEGAADAAILIAEDPWVDTDVTSDVPTVVLLPPNDPGAAARRLSLTDSELVDPRLRGLELSEPLPRSTSGSAPADDAVLATVNRTPVWTFSRRPEPLHRLASPLPELGEDESLRSLFGRHPLPLIAIMHLLRALDGERLETTPLRAAFLFDDPNLRRPTYGYLDFEQLADDAARHSYHASMAMIPLDARFPHRSTVELFRRRPGHLSLAIHGNDHRASELLNPGSEQAALALAAQALRRTASFGRRNQLRVDRVMVPPHGMCSPAVTRALGSLGYSALCAIHPYPWRESPPTSAPLAGWDRAEFAAGSAVIPRVHIDSDPRELAICAFLEQPLVIYGHHTDLAGGLDRLREIASLLTRFGEVRWMSLESIAETNYRAHRAGDVLVVEPFANRLKIEVPDWADSVQVAPPRDPEKLFAGWSSEGSGQVQFDVPFRSRLSPLELRLDPLAAVDPSTVRAPRTTGWPIARRMATETRDRLAPLLASGPS
jgi:hypothetical protein